MCPVFLAICFILLLVLGFLYYKNVDCDFRTFYAEKLGTSPRSLSDKVIWIVGASSGIGEFITYELAKYECKIVISARRQDELERVKKECLSRSGIADDSVTILPMDVLNLDEHRHKFNAVLEKYGQLDILVNNAGRTQRARWETIELDVDKQMFDLNVFAPVHLTRVVYPHFAERRSGHVVNMSSLAGFLGVPGSASYTGAKHALHGYMESLRTEKVGDNIDVTMLCPGPVHSNLLTTAFTNKPNEVYNKEWSLIDKRMATDRCAQLSVIAIANKVQVSWICLNPLLITCYLRIYFPDLSHKLLKMFGYKKLSKMRDGNARSATTKDK